MYSQMIKRQRFSKIPTQGNYYPLAAAGYLEDKHVRMTIATGQPLGAASMASGQFEVSIPLQIPIHKATLIPCSTYHPRFSSQIMQDRRLMQDDNRGLSQGVTDNLLTYHQFSLLLEKRQESCPHPVPPAEHPAGLLSLAGHLALEDLLHPVLGLHPRSVFQLDLVPGFSALGADLPADLNIISLRVIPIPDGAGKGVGMVLHRQALNLCWGDPKLQQRFHVSKTGEVDLSKFLNHWQYWTISEAPLTFANVGAPRRSPVVSLCPHQMLSLLLHKTDV